MRRSLVPLALLALAGCSQPTDDEFLCLAVWSPALVVEVLDSATDANITPATTIYASTGTWRDSLGALGYRRVGDTLVVTRKGGAHERAGTYRLELSAPGYRSRAVDGVRVDRGPCGVSTVTRVERLDPAP